VIVGIIQKENLHFLYCLTLLLKNGIPKEFPGKNEESAINNESDDLDVPIKFLFSNKKKF
jgi:hypothetical protein